MGQSWMTTVLLMALYFTFFQLLFKDFKMAFKMTQRPTFRTMVTLNIPSDVPGRFDKCSFIGVFKRLPLQDVQAMQAEGLSNEDVVRRTLVDWEMKDMDTGEDVPFCRDTLEAALQITPTALNTAQAFFEGSMGGRAKN